MEQNTNERAFVVKFTLKNNNIQTQMQTQFVSPQEALGLLEMAKDQILDNLKKGRKEIFQSFKKPE